MGLSDNILLPVSDGVNKVARDLAGRVRNRRLERNLTQSALASRADMPLSTYRRFEQTGEISLAALLRIAVAMDALTEFYTLFDQRQYQSIGEVLEQDEAKLRKRGRNNG